MYSLADNDYLFFDLNHNDVDVFYLDTLKGKKIKFTPSAGKVFSNILKSQKYHLFILKNGDILLQQLLRYRSKQVIRDGLNGVPTQFVVISNRKVKKSSQVAGAVIVLPV